MNRHLLKLMDWSSQEILDVLNMADQMKYNQKHGLSHKVLEGKTLAMIFQKASTRTRVSFEVGMFQLGGHALFLTANDLQIGRGEPIQDTARVLSRYADGIMIRTFAQKEVEDLAQFGSIPVINGLSDFAHPCQTLADLMTIREHHSMLSGLNLCFIGDANNVCNSTIVGALQCGLSVKIAIPYGYAIDPIVLAFASNYKNFSIVHDPLEAAVGADVVYTDVWTSMGQETETKKREKDFEGFQVNAKLMKLTSPKAMVLHCLPAHRGEEITNEMMEKHADEIFSQAENRLHAQKAVLAKLLG